MLDTFTSKRPTLPYLRRHKLAAVINVSDEPNLAFHTTPCPYFWFPILEDSYWGYTAFYSAAKVVDRYKGRIMIHCRGGVCRSPLVEFAIRKADTGYGATVSHYGEQRYENLAGMFTFLQGRGNIPPDVIPVLRARKQYPHLDLAKLIVIAGGSPLLSSWHKPHENYRNYENGPL